MSQSKTEDLGFFHPDRIQERKDRRKVRRQRRRDRREDQAKFSIDKLRHNFDQGARANRYVVGIYCDKLKIKMDGIRCVNATLPGRTLETTDFSEYGPTRKMPFNVNYGGEFNMTFICDSTFLDRYIIDAWNGAIFSKGSGKSGGSVNHPQFLYYDEYIGRVEVEQYNQDAQPSLLYTFEEAYPVSYAAQELSYENGEIMKLEVTFAFRYFQTTYKAPNSVSGINKGRRALDILLDIKNLRKGGNKANDGLQRFNDQLSKFAGIIGIGFRNKKDSYPGTTSSSSPSPSPSGGGTRGGVA